MILSFDIGIKNLAYCLMYKDSNIQNTNNIKIIKWDIIQLIEDGVKCKGVSLDTITQVLYYLRKNKLLKNKYFKINVTKNIPLGSGLGGGSSNAGSMLKTLNELFDLNLNNHQLLNYCKKLGSDCVFFLTLY